VETFKSQPKELAFCLRCDFNGLWMSFLCACSSVLMIFLAADPRCSSDNDEWEMKTNRKIVLCFSQPEPRTEWLKVRDPFVNFN
jgi:hypothetical protein